MAKQPMTADETFQPSSAHSAFISFSTALVLLPPPSVQTRVNALRVANDKSYPRWTAHVTLIFPFASRESLPVHLESLRSAIRASEIKPFELCLDSVGQFRQREYETVYLGPMQTSTERSCGNEEVHSLWRVLAQTLGYSGRDFVPHMTLGQTSHRETDIESLRNKGARLITNDAPKWLVDRVVVLQKDELDGGRMKIVDELLLDGVSATARSSIASEEWPSFEYSPDDTAWIKNLNPPYLPSFPKELSVMTFNVLHDSTHPTPARLDKIREALLARDGDIVCLQEVSDETLSALLCDESIRSRWRWCTRSPALCPMESERNIVILANHHFPFRWRRISLGGKHKCAAVLTLGGRQHLHSGETPFTIVFAAIHLTAGLSPVHLDAKSNELLSLIHYLQEAHPGDDWIIAGDTNIPSGYILSSAVRDVLEDVWEPLDILNLTDIYNATYDPDRNDLAAQTARENLSPQRYDRMYVKRGGHVRARSVEVLVNDNDPASDHWPLRATFHLSMRPAARADLPHITCGTEHLSCSPRPLSRPPSFKGPVEDQKDLAPDSELYTFAQTFRAIPNVDERRQRRAALQLLCKTIGASLEGDTHEGQLQTGGPTGPGSNAPATPVQLVLVPVGSYALSVDFPDSDLDCVVVGNISPPLFWALVKQRIASQSNANAPHRRGAVALKRFVRDAAVQMMVLDVCETKVDVQYCPAAEVAENWPEYSNSLEKEILLPVSAMRVLNAHRDRLRLQDFMPSSPSVFQLAYRSIKIYCIRHGIFAARFGYLGGIHLSILLCRLAEISSGTASAMAFVREFFSVYSQFNWEQELASIRGVNTTYRRSLREPLVILSPERPVRNVAANASVSTRQAISTELRMAHERLSLGEPWSRVCGDAREYFYAFLGNYDEYVKVDLGYWGDSCMFARALIGFVESRLVRLLVDLHSAYPSLSVRLWPERLTDLATEPQRKGSSIHGFYLLALRHSVSQNAKPLFGTLQGFEESIRNNDNYFDASNCFLLASECLRSSLSENIIVDEPTWSDGGIDEVGDDELIAWKEDLENRDFGDVRQTSSRRAQAVKVKCTPYLPAEKLRTSNDVYNRLMWDPQLDTNDYVIGYEDRFDGVKEIPIKNWKRNVEDEAFIPFHRVVHFRCKSTGDLVWDRRSKLDHVFGSGASHQ